MALDSDNRVQPPRSCDCGLTAGPTPIAERALTFARRYRHTTRCCRNNGACKDWRGSAMNQSKITRRELLQAYAASSCLAAVPFAQSASNELVTPAAEYFKHFAALSKLSIAVADAIPAS